MDIRFTEDGIYITEIDLWLDPAKGDPTPLLAPYPAEAMTAQPVATEVNKAWDSKVKQPIDHPGLIEPLPPKLL